MEQNPEGEAPGVHRHRALAAVLDERLTAMTNDERAAFVDALEAARRRLDCEP